MARKVLKVLFLCLVAIGFNSRKGKRVRERAGLVWLNAYCTGTCRMRGAAFRILQRSIVLICRAEGVKRAIPVAALA